MFERLPDRSTLANDACGKKFIPRYVPHLPRFTMISVATHAVTRYERRMHVARHSIRLAAAAVAIMAFSASARAEQASVWSDDTSSAMRLITGAGKGATLQAGVEIKLQPG